MRAAGRAVVGAAALLVGLAVQAPPTGRAEPAAPGACSPTVTALRFSDALDKKSSGPRISGLSALARDGRTGRYLALPDHTGPNRAEPDHTGTTALVWPLTGLDDLPVARPRVAGAPIRLRGRDGRLLPGRDNEGLAVLGPGGFAVSSEAGPSITVFGWDGRRRYDVAVPPHFRTAPLGRARPNASLEGLTASPSGDRLIAAMERPLIGDDLTAVRMLDYRRTAAGRFTLVRELRYRPAPGMRVAEISAYGDDRLVVLEGAYSPRRGSRVVLATTDIGSISGSDRVRRVIRRPLADLARCPTMGATTRQFQPNPLLDNYEGMAVVHRPGGSLIHLVSDDNHSPRQTTRLLTLWAMLP